VKNNYKNNPKKTQQVDGEVPKKDVDPNVFNAGPPSGSAVGQPAAVPVNSTPQNFPVR
jgi:hypothetical protein